MNPHLVEPGQRSHRRHHRRLDRGFTLIELIVVVIVIGVLAAIAVPRFVNLSHAARAATVQTLYGALQTAATETHLLCLMDAVCDPNAGFQYTPLNGTLTVLAFGYPNAGDYTGEIDSLVLTDGFSISFRNVYVTRFTRDDAPDPSTCYVEYQEAIPWWTPPLVPTFIVNTDSC